MKPERNRRDLRARACESEQGFWQRCHAMWMQSAREWRQHAVKHHTGYAWWRNALENARQARLWCRSIP